MEGKRVRIITGDAVRYGVIEDMPSKEETGQRQETGQAVRVRMDDTGQCEEFDRGWELVEDNGIENIAQPDQRKVLTGREIVDGDFCLEKSDMTVDWQENLAHDGAWWSYNLTACVPVDDIFGTNVETDENDDVLNIYARVSPGYDDVSDNLQVILFKEDGSIEEFDRPLTGKEKKVILRMVRPYEIARLQKEHLDNYLRSKGRTTLPFTIELTCPECGNSTFCYRGDDFECLACGEICEETEMSSKIVTIEPTHIR